MVGKAARMPSLGPTSGALVEDRDVCSDERAAVGRALDPELPVECGEAIGQPEESAPVAPSASDARRRRTAA